jgi:lysozyme
MREPLSLIHRILRALIEKLKELLIRHEGLKLFPYRDSLGRLSIGVGRNLEVTGVSQEEVQLLLDNDIKQAIQSASTLPWYSKLNETRQIVILSMIFNMGLGGLLKFKGMIRAIEHGDFYTAADEMLDSRLTTQVGIRAHELAGMMRLG